MNLLAQKVVMVCAHNTTMRIAIAPPFPITTAAAAGAARPALV